MLWSCTCIIVKMCPCLNILELNWVISCSNWGRKFHNKPRTGVVNMRLGESPLYFPIYRQNFELEYFLSKTNYVSLEPYLPWNVPWWIGKKICSLPYETSWLYWWFLIIYFYREKNQEWVDLSTHWHVHPNFNNQVVWSVNILQMYLKNLSILWGLGNYFLVCPSITGKIYITSEIMKEH